ncbi:EAL domain-containing protein [Planomonospora sp. ID67723]|uniref:putative bifunctional diguanylate cyclase/phosphodiesterase n=1 Tax=Planomonospora sp. ID67723 TaxID=2738134 RepID=UPI0018C359E6|nr:EAL domain-containing protein [Planomonospora sp. ID67723]MBG0833350.1 EAL domain-containing protein [Planomonospora sp. ID67723]
MTTRQEKTMQPDASLLKRATDRRRRGTGIRSRLWLVFLLAGAALSVAGLLLPDQAGVMTRLLVSIGAVITMVAGIRRQRPAAAAAWRLLAAGLAAWVGADLLWTGWYLRADGGEVPPWIDLAYLAAYPLLIAGLGKMPGNSIRSRNVGVMLDAMVIVLGLLFVYWTMSFNPYGGFRTLSGRDLLLASTFPFADMIVHFMAVRLWFTHGLRNPSYAMLNLGLAGMLFGDVTYAMMLQRGESWNYGLLGNAGWLVWFVLMGASVLHPAARGAETRAARLTTARSLTFLVAACAGPLSLAFNMEPGTVVRPSELVVPMAIFIVLMVFLVFRLITNTNVAERRASLLDEQAAELSRALEEQQALQQLLSHRAMHDHLTGLANRALFHDRLEQATVRRAPEARHALLMLDLDGFKHVNDTYGHPAGDQLLVQAGHRLGEILREADTLARLGGDEFAILLEDVSAEEAGHVAARVVDVMARPFAVGEHSFHVTASVGLYMIAESAAAQDVMRDADLALYAAKAAGKNQISVFHPGLRVEQLGQARLTEGLRRALEREEFVLNYQPVVDLATGQVQAVEALLRWQSPDGIVPPDAFIPTAEETGLVVPIGAQVLRRACRDAALWYERYGIAVNVNVSGRQLRRKEFVSSVLTALEESGLPGDALILEITETALLATGREETARVIGYLSDLRRHGVRIAIDDFGTGYSSLAYLQHLPVDVVKIDGAFTTLERGTDSDSRQRHAFTKAILSLCESLDLPAIAEKVETSEQEEFLRDMHCPLGQGYLFSRPVPAAELGRLLTEGEIEGPSGRRSPLGGPEPAGGERLAG